MQFPKESRLLFILDPSCSLKPNLKFTYLSQVLPFRFLQDQQVKSWRT